MVGCMNLMGASMRKLFLVGISAFATVMLGGAVQAADMPVKAAPPPPAPTYSWTGCYIGGGGGYGMWNQDINFLAPFDPPSSVGLQSTAGGRGWFGTAQVGCDYQLSGNWVIGAFADWDFGDIRGSGTATSVLGLGAREHQKWSWAAGGRIGYVVMPNLLTYVSGGFTQAHFNAAEVIDIVDGDPQGFQVPAHTFNGWFIGTGYEYGLQWWPGLFWKTEYRWAQYESANLAFVADPGFVSPNEGIHTRKFEQTIRSELVWRFNWAGPVRGAY